MQAALQVKMKDIPGSKKKSLWRCPKCGHKFVTRNLWHSCSRHTLREHFHGKPAALRRLFNEWLAFVRRCGPVTVYAQKTRIVFMVRVRFAGAVMRKSYVRCGFWLKRRVESPRFDRIEQITKRDHVYTFRLTDPGQLDEELAIWAHEAYAIGCQEL